MHPRECAGVHADIQLRSADSRDDEMSVPSLQEQQQHLVLDSSADWIGKIIITAQKHPWDTPHINNCRPIMRKSQMNIHQSYSIQLWPHIKECPLHETMHLCSFRAQIIVPFTANQNLWWSNNYPRCPIQTMSPGTQIAAIFSLGTPSPVSYLRQHK
jgi:hypothetical protein